MNKYKVISCRYGAKMIDEFETLEEAIKDYNEKRSSDECFVDEIQDEYGNVLNDNKENVIGHTNYKSR